MKKLVSMLVLLFSLVGVLNGCGGTSEADYIARLSAGDLDADGMKWLAQQGSFEAAAALLEASVGTMASDPYLSEILAEFPQSEEHCSELISSGNLNQKKGAILQAAFAHSGLKKQVEEALEATSDLEELRGIVSISFGSSDKLFRVTKVSAGSATLSMTNPTDGTLRFSTGFLSCEGADQPTLATVSGVKVEPGETGEFEVKCQGATPTSGCEFLFPTLVGTYATTLTFKVK